jgi:hypothetical protein
MSRQGVVDAAIRHIGNPDTDAIWKEALAPKDYQPGITKAWCGATALTCLHEAGLAQNVFWIWGLGFLEVNHLPKVKLPEPGDIAYYDKPYQHHAIVESVDGDTLHTIDGNQGHGFDQLTGKAGTTCRRVHRPISHGVYYSIAPWLPKTEPAPPPGPSVAEVQHRLNESIAKSKGDPLLAPLNGHLLVVNGELDTPTIAALRWLQSYCDKPITGEIDEATLQVLGL